MLDFTYIRIKATSKLWPPSPFYQRAHNSFCTRVSKNRVERKSFNSLGMMTKEKFARLDWRAGPTLFCGGEVGFEEDGGWGMKGLKERISAKG